MPPVIHHKNPKFGFPNLAAAGNHKISRGKFLNSTYRAYWGPGQRPDAAEPTGYYPPTDWMPAGYCLRLPQVVWLYLSKPGMSTTASHRVSAQFDGPFRDAFGSGTDFFQVDPQIWQMNAYPDGKISAIAYVQTPETSGPYPMTLGAWSRNSSIDPPGHHAYTFSNWGGTFNSSGMVDPVFEETIDDAYQAEYDRVKAIYMAVKSAIELKRPGRTWVNIIDPWDYGTTGSLQHIPPQYFGTDHGVFSVPGPVDSFFPGQPIEYWPMLNPADTSDYLGTDFLMVYCGSPDTTEVLINDASPDVDGGRQSFVELARGHSIATIVGSATKFRQYSIRYFGLDPILEAFSHYTGGTAVPPPAFDITLGSPPDDFICHVFATKAEADADRTYVAQAFWTEVDSGVITGIDSYIDGLNTVNSNAKAANIAQLQQDATDLAALGVDASYVGGSSLATGSAYLVNLIASHYGFSPSTGADL
jgi:hypothetical protein